MVRAHSMYVSIIACEQPQRVEFELIIGSTSMGCDDVHCS